MITETPTSSLSSAEQRQIMEIDSARGAWQEGRPSDALLLMEGLKGQAMTHRVRAKYFVAEAAFRAEAGDLLASLESLEIAAPIIDFADVAVRGSFHLQRARVHNSLGDTDAALTDYSGALALWEAIGDKEKQGAAYLNIAELYLKIRQFEIAGINLRKSIALLTDSASFYLPQAYDTQAKIFLAEGRLEQAAHAINEALATVGDNDGWRRDFLNTLDAIEVRLLEVLKVKYLSDWDRVKLNMVRRALQRSEGNPAGAASELGVTRHAIFSLINTHKEALEQYRKPKRVRRRSVITKL